MLECYLRTNYSKQDNRNFYESADGKIGIAGIFYRGF